MAEWGDLRRELDLWAGAGRVATFWWRDDDAGPAEDRLAALLAQRRALAVPLALAVVPAWLDEAAAATIRGDPGARVLQHGIAHDNRARPPARKMELVAEAPDLDDGLVFGRSELARAFGARFHGVMVPPWNRIDDAVARRLSRLGFTGLSTLGPRRSARRHGLALANVHIDIVDWRTRGFAGEAGALGAALDHLARRRRGEVDGDEPTGLMTHHRIHDDACRRFVDAFVACLRDHGGARWLDAGEVFASAGGQGE